MQKFYFSYVLTVDPNRPIITGILGPFSEMFLKISVIILHSLNCKFQAYTGSWVQILRIIAVFWSILKIKKWLLLL